MDNGSVLLVGFKAFAIIVGAAAGGLAVALAVIIVGFFVGKGVSFFSEEAKVARAAKKEEKKAAKEAKALPQEA